MATQPTAVPLEQTIWTPDEQAEFARLVRERQQWKMAESISWAPTDALVDLCRAVVSIRFNHPKMTDKQIEECRKDYDKRIESMLLLPGAPEDVRFDQWDIQRAEGSSGSKLDPKRLLELGVSASTIQQATVAGKSYSYVLVKEVRP